MQENGDWSPSSFILQHFHHVLGPKPSKHGDFKCVYNMTACFEQMNQQFYFLRHLLPHNNWNPDNCSYQVHFSPPANPLYFQENILPLSGFEPLESEIQLAVSTQICHDTSLSRYLHWTHRHH